MAYRASFVKSIQSGTITIGAAATTNTATVTAVDVANTVLYFEGNSVTAGSSGDGFCHLVLTNSTTITATRVFSTGSVEVSYRLVEHYPGLLKSVQSFTISWADTVSGAATATISAVDPAKTFLSYLGIGIGDNVSGAAANWLVELVLTNSTTVTGTRQGSSNLAVVSGQVVELK